MAKIITCAKVPVRTGAYGTYASGAHAVQSCFGVPGSNEPAAYYRTNFNVYVAVFDDMTTYVGLGGGDVRQQKLSTGGKPYWGVALYVNKTPFSISISQGSDGLNWPNSTGGAQQVYFDRDGMVNIEGSGVTPADMKWTVPDYGAARIGATSVPSGYVRVTPIVNWNNDGSSTIYLDVGGCAMFTSAVTNPISIGSETISIKNEELIGLVFDYYPWERMIDNTWKSLNREKGPTTQTNVGLFRRGSDKWNPVSNTETNNASDQHGFRYNNGWQKSPKSGQGA